MNFHINQTLAQSVLKLLEQIDEGYLPSNDEIESLNEVCVADFSKLGLRKLPESISLLSRVKVLNVSNNELTNLPDGIGELIHLNTLYASYNQLTSLPETIAKLSQLKILYLSDNLLTSLPNGVTHLIYLTALDVSNNQLENLPERIDNFSKLISLNISNNQLKDLPNSITKLPLLTTFDASNNQLINLPKSFGSLSQLAALYLSGNRLINLADDICNLSSLSILSLSDNKLTSLPNNIGNLRCLEELNISNNQIQSLPKSICELSRLISLELHGIGLEEVPQYIQHLSNLKILDLSGNSLKILPEWLGNFSKLDVLNLSSLHLVELPYSLLELNIPFLSNIYSIKHIMNEKKGIYISDMTLSLQPVSLFDQTRDNSPYYQESRKLIKDYFESPKISVREAKVIFLGDGLAGKTYTIQRLLNNCNKGDYPTKETHGILIEDLIIKRDGELYKIRIWDFGGQDIMHEMHRCFLTDRTCYVVMVDTRTDKQTGRARYWLRTVQSIAPKVPVLLLVNEFSGGRNRDLDYTSLKEEFANIADIQYCSSKDDSVEDFYQKVKLAIIEQALNLDSCKMELPKSWDNVRQNLLSMRSADNLAQNNIYYIDNQTFFNLCDQYAVPSDNGLRAWLLTWFNDLGICFSFHLEENKKEQLINYKILDPMWLTSAIYKIIWEKERTDDGLISLSEIYNILGKPGSREMKKDGIPCLENVFYNEMECGYILNIMRKFNISYPADKYTEFMPALCKPDSKLDPVPATYRQHGAYKFCYAFLPENVLHRLMIYFFLNLRPGKRWRRGFWLECKAQGLSAVIRTMGQYCEENELRIDIYSQKEQYDIWMWLQPICQQIISINKVLSLNPKIFILAENDEENKWFLQNSIWYWKKQGQQYLQGDKTLFNIDALMKLVYGRFYSEEEDRLTVKQDNYRCMESTETFINIFTEVVAKKLD